MSNFHNKNIIYSGGLTGLTLGIFVMKNFYVRKMENQLRIAGLVLFVLFWLALSVSLIVLTR